jgi:dihydrofolate synthase/folylpolyglutamate synthase
LNYPDSVGYLYALGNEHKAFKLGLDPVTRLLHSLGNPHDAFRSIHVAGTNGKGSTCAMIESGLRYTSRRTGLFTSPHLVEPTERIRIDGVDVSHERFAQAFNYVHAVAEELVRRGDLEAHPSYFETVTAMAFCVFRDERIDTAVVEVGLGGRLDATNVISPELCVITAIDYDHEAWLGSSLESIASEKAGILKPGVPGVFAPQRREAEVVLNERAAELGCPIDHATDHNVEIVQARSDGTEFLLDGDRFRCPLAGIHQVENAATAILALRKFTSDAADIANGIQQASWPGRLEKVAWNPDIILDGAHNPAGARALASHVRKFFAGRRIVLIYGAMRDKSVSEVAELLFPLAAEVIITAPSSTRALRPETIAQNSEHPNLLTIESVSAAIDLVRSMPPDTAVFITGSLYLVGEARALLVK